MHNLVVHVTPGPGSFSAAAKRGPQEHNAVSTSPEMAARMAAAGLLRLHLADVQAVKAADGIWTATPRHGALIAGGTP